MSAVTQVADPFSLPTAELVAFARGGAPGGNAAWEVLVKRHVGLVWKVVRSFNLSPEESWEAFQSTWLRAIERLETLVEMERFSGWLVTVARNEALAVIRRGKKLVPSESVPERCAEEAPL